SQLPRLNRVLALKDLGLSLDQIGRVLDEGVGPEQLRGMLRLRQAEAQQQVEEDRARLAGIGARLRQIGQEANMPDYDVVIKNVAPEVVASLRRVIPDYPAVGVLFAELTGALDPAEWISTGKMPLTAAIYHDDGFKERDVDAEAVVFLKHAPSRQSAV